MYTKHTIFVLPLLPRGKGKRIRGQKKKKVFLSIYAVGHAYEWIALDPLHNSKASSVTLIT